MSERRTVFVTKYALTDGIIECETLESDHNGEKYQFVKWLGGCNGRKLFTKHEWRPTLFEAQERAREMAKSRLKSLEKQRKRLEAIVRDGVKVKEQAE